MTITPLPPAPDRTDPATFSDKADVFVAALPAFVTQTNAAASTVDADKITTQGFKNDAEAARDAAEGFKNGAETARDASEGFRNTSQAWAESEGQEPGGAGTKSAKEWSGVAEGYKDSAEVAAAAAQASAGLPALVGNAGNVLAVTSGEDGVEFKSGAVAAGIPSFTGNAGKALVANVGETALEFADAGGGPTLTAIASGTLANGDTVVINSDGTVSAVSGVFEGTGTPTVFESASSNSMRSTFDSNSNKVVVAYKDAGNSNFVTAVVGTVSGTSISFGSPVVVISNSSFVRSLTFDSFSNKVVLITQNQTTPQQPQARIGTVSGTSISFGGITAISFNSHQNYSSTFDSVSNKVILAYRDISNSRGRARVGTVSGTSISFGAETNFIGNDIGGALLSLAFDSNSNRVVIVFQNNDSTGRAVVGTVSGTSISFGSPVQFSTNATEFSSVFDSNSNKIVIAYRDAANSSFGTVRVGTVSGTSISFGSAVVFEAASVSSVSAAFDSDSNKVVIAYTDNANSNFGTAVVGTVSGTSISFEPPVVFESASSDFISATFDSNSNKVVIAYRDRGNSDFGTASVFQIGSTNLTEENYIGISDDNYSDTTEATIQLVGSVDDAQSGLSAGEKYFLQLDGTLSTTAGVPEVYAGLAVSATEIIVKG